MAKTKPPTENEMHELSERASDLLADLSAMSDRFVKAIDGQAIPDLVSFARTFATLSRECSTLTVTLLLRDKIDAQRAEVNRLRAEQAKA